MKTLVIFPPVDSERLDAIRRAAGELQVVNAQSPDEAAAAMPDATAFFGKLTPDLLARSTRLEWVQSPTASLEHFLFPELIEHPCQLTNMRGLFNDVIADHVMGFVLCFARNLHHYLRRQIAHRWEPVGGEATRPSFATGPGQVSEIDRAHRHLSDCTLGVVGVGQIGTEILKRAAAFGMTLRGVDLTPRTLTDPPVDIAPLSELDSVLADCDFVVIAAPHTPQTAGMFGRAQFQRMKRSAYLVNIGRGVIVRLADLTAALLSGEIAGAALDVFEIEPLPPDHPLWDMENVIITPHVAAASPRIAERHLATFLENLRRYLAGVELSTPVEKTQWF